MTTGELKAEWNLILVKKKKKAGQEFFFFFLMVDLNTIMCNFKIDIHAFIKIWLFSFLKFFHELSYKCNWEETKVENDPP